MKQDPKITLANAIIAGWNGAADLDSSIDTIGFKDSGKEVLINTEWFEEKYNHQPQITISVVTEKDQPFELGYGTVRVNAIYQIDCWAPILRETAKGPGNAKKWKWQLYQEVKRIMKANLTGLTDIALCLLDQTSRGNLDELDRSPPLLRYMQQVGIIYDI